MGSSGEESSLYCEHDNLEVSEFFSDKLFLWLNKMETYV